MDVLENKFVVQENYIFNHNYILTKVKFGNDKSRSRETGCWESRLIRMMFRSSSRTTVTHMQL